MTKRSTATDMYMTDAQYLETLKRQQSLIENGLEGVSLDSNTVGDKFTSFSWGLCSHRKETYPTRDLHLFPDDFDDHGRIAPKYYRRNQPCPFDMRTDKERETDLNGCYWTCAHFQAHKYPDRLDRDAAIARYKQRIIATDKG